MIARLGFWVLDVEVASLFAEPLNVAFGLLARWVGLGAPAHSVESFLGDENTACFVAGIGVECIARHLFE